MDKGIISARLLALDSCALSDAADRLGLAGAVPGFTRFATDERIAGEILTVKLAAGKPANSTRHLCTQAIEAADAGDVIIVEQSTGIEAAGWGGVLSNAAAGRGLAGVIVEGPARDIDEAVELGFPVFARRATCITARGRIYEEASNVPIRVGDVLVNSGDFVIADASGIVIIGRSDIDRVLAAAEAIAERERLMTRDVRKGRPVGEVMGADYETMLERDR